MPFEDPKLPYDNGALAPHISKETVDFHYGKHHLGYVKKLNAATAGTPLEEKSLVDLVRTADGGIFNNAAQIWNHTFYWNSMSPNGGGEPSGAIADAINRDFGSFEKFKTEFSTVAAGHFGSGWAWVVQDPADNKLRILATHDAYNPLRDGMRPILTCDVWEHAYYIDFRNDRGSYVAAWWKLINWEFANANLKA